MYLYLASAAMSLFTLIMALVGMDLDPESKFYMFWGGTETWFCIGVSVIFLILGFVVDNRKGDEE